VISWLGDISTDLSLFRQYDWLLAEEPLFRDILVDVYAAIIKLWSQATFNLRRKREGKRFTWVETMRLRLLAADLTMTSACDVDFV
jgi:hypothetical protein